MRIAGIIAEYHPFHRGHLHQIDQLRALGAQKIFVVMSTYAVQRGELALLPPHIRARAAVEAGADLVAALPAPCACARAEDFAAAGVALLTALGADTLAFGVENGTGVELTALAELLESESFSEAVKRKLSAGVGFAAARQQAVEELSPALAPLLGSPNSILGVEYCKAIIKQGSGMVPLPLPRLGADHDSGIAAEGIASASHIRALLTAGGLDAAAPYLPERLLPLYREAIESGLLLDKQRAEIAILSRLRWLDADRLAQARGLSEGLENRLAAAIRTAGSLTDLLETLKTKRYPTARLRRLALDAALGYTGELPVLPPYIHVLAAKKDALPCLKHAALPAGTSLADLRAYCPALADAEAAAADLAALCREKPQPMGLAYTLKPTVVNGKPGLPPEHD